MMGPKKKSKLTGCGSRKRWKYLSEPAPLALSTAAAFMEAYTPSAAVEATSLTVAAVTSTEKRAQMQSKSSTAPASSASATAEATLLEAAKSLKEQASTYVATTSTAALALS